MAMTTRCSDLRGSLAGALWPHEPNPPHKLNVFIVKLSCTLFPRLLMAVVYREAGHAQTRYEYAHTKFIVKLRADLLFAILYVHEATCGPWSCPFSLIVCLETPCPQLGCSSIFFKKNSISSSLKSLHVITDNIVTTPANRVGHTIVIALLPWK